MTSSWIQARSAWRGSGDAGTREFERAAADGGIEEIRQLVRSLERRGLPISYELLISRTDCFVSLSANDQGLREFRHKTTGMIYVLVPAGEFMMGSPDGEGDDDEHPQHRVVFDSPFLMAKYPLTSQAWFDVTGDYPCHFPTDDMLSGQMEGFPAASSCTHVDSNETWCHRCKLEAKDDAGFKWADHPVETVSWDQCRIYEDMVNRIDFARQTGCVFFEALPGGARGSRWTWPEWEMKHPLRRDGQVEVPKNSIPAGQPVNHIYFDSQIEAQYLAWLWDEKGRRRQWMLPTEAMWEYTCRAGTTTTYPNGDTDADLEKIAWFGGEWEEGHKAVGRKDPNNWGLHDNCGNVFEWCRDRWSQDYRNAPEDGFLAVGEDRPDPIPRFVGTELIADLPEVAASGRTTSASTTSDQERVPTSGAGTERRVSEPDLDGEPSSDPTSAGLPREASSSGGESTSCAPTTASSTTADLETEGSELAVDGGDSDPSVSGAAARVVTCPTNVVDPTTVNSTSRKTVVGIAASGQPGGSSSDPTTDASGEGTGRACGSCAGTAPGSRSDGEDREPEDLGGDSDPTSSSSVVRPPPIGTFTQTPSGRIRGGEIQQSRTGAAEELEHAQDGDPSPDPTSMAGRSSLPGSVPSEDQTGVGSLARLTQAMPTVLNYSMQQSSSDSDQVGGHSSDPTTPSFGDVTRDVSGQTSASSTQDSDQDGGDSDPTTVSDVEEAGTSAVFLPVSPTPTGSPLIVGTVSSEPEESGEPSPDFHQGASRSTPRSSDSGGQNTTTGCSTNHVSPQPDPEDLSFGSYGPSGLHSSSEEVPGRISHAQSPIERGLVANHISAGSAQDGVRDSDPTVFSAREDPSTSSGSGVSPVFGHHQEQGSEPSMQESDQDGGDSDPTLASRGASSGEDRPQEARTGIVPQQGSGDTETSNPSSPPAQDGGADPFAQSTPGTSERAEEVLTGGRSMMTLPSGVQREEATQVSRQSMTSDSESDGERDSDPSMSDACGEETSRPGGLSHSRLGGDLPSTGAGSHTPPDSVLPEPDQDGGVEAGADGWVLEPNGDWYGPPGMEEVHPFRSGPSSRAGAGEIRRHRRDSSSPVENSPSRSRRGIGRFVWPGELDLAEDMRPSTYLGLAGRTPYKRRRQVRGNSFDGVNMSVARRDFMDVEMARSIIGTRSAWR